MKLKHGTDTKFDFPYVGMGKSGAVHILFYFTLDNQSNKKITGEEDASI